MPDYERTTTETTLERLPAVLRDALHARLEDLELGSPTATLRARGMDVPEADGVDVTGFPRA